MSSMQHGWVDVSAIETMDTMMLIFKIIVIPLTTCIHQLWVGSGTYCVIVLCYHHHHHYYQFMRVRDHDKYFVQNSFGAWWYWQWREIHGTGDTYLSEKLQKMYKRRAIKVVMLTIIINITLVLVIQQSGRSLPPAGTRGLSKKQQRRNITQQNFTTKRP